MADQTEIPEIPDEAVEAAAAAWANRIPDMATEDRWKALPESGRRMRRLHMRIALDAALPHLTAGRDAELAELREDHERNRQRLFELGPIIDALTHGGVAEELVRLRAAQPGSCEYLLPVASDPEDAQTCDQPCWADGNRCSEHDPRHVEYVAGLQTRVRELEQSLRDAHAYGQTTKYHQDRHAEAHRELVKAREEISALRRLHDERDTIERSHRCTPPGTNDAIAAELDRFAGAVGELTRNPGWHAVASLVVKLLTDRADALRGEHRDTDTTPPHVHTDACMCVMAPMEVEGANECNHCGDHFGGVCTALCEVARQEFDLTHPARQWAVRHPDVELAVHRSPHSVLYTASKLPGGVIVTRLAGEEEWVPEAACLCGDRKPAACHFEGCPDTPPVREPRVWQDPAGVPQDEPGLRIRDTDGDEAARLDTGEWQWVLVCDEPGFNETPWPWPADDFEFPATEVLPVSTPGGES